jgi:hypothetical protein
MTRLKLAELTSGVGALVLGVGLGALFPRWFGPAAGLITMAGLILHAFGMWDKHRVEAHAQVASPWWVTTLYWICWLLIIILIAMLLTGANRDRAMIYSPMRANSPPTNIATPIRPMTMPTGSMTMVTPSASPTTINTKPTMTAAMCPSTLSAVLIQGWWNKAYAMSTSE